MSTTNRFICIHGHFYQPPRENPWLEEVELQDSARPYHDWNERITAECYAPNTAARILDAAGNITAIVNNYAEMSFNFGPTLLTWLERHNPEVYRAILDADAAGRETHSGHGPALAQVYSHMIMPLACTRDKRTQIRWGRRDFEHRFGRSPEGMWLAETAVDLETLDLMAREGIVFTILAPHQARRVRKIGGRSWQDVSGQRIDPRQPYLCRLPSGRSIAVFFYDGPISLDVSFRDLLGSGEGFAARLVSAFSSDPAPQLVSIATDGETYGHHHKYGEMGLTYCMHHLRSNNLARMTVFGEFLEMFPPRYEVDLLENTSWSCAHGVERWRDDCGCKIGTDPNWHQRWRKPLREALDWLRDTLAPMFEQGCSGLFEHPWQVRDDYIEILLHNDPACTASFLARHAGRELARHEQVKALQLLELQRNAMLMYTSCGWFFDDIAGIEATQLLCYASRAVHLARDLFHVDLEEQLTHLLAKAPGNRPECENGAVVYARSVKPAAVDLLRAGAHFAVSSFFEDYPESLDFFSFRATRRMYELHQAGNLRLAVGQATIMSHTTWDECDIDFALLHLGDHNIIGGVRPFSGAQACADMRAEIDQAFMISDIPGVTRLIEKHFGTNNYSLWHLFKDEQRKVLNQVIAETLESHEAFLRQACNRYYPIMQVMESMSIPLPRPFFTTVEATINSDLLQLLHDGETDLEKLRIAVREAERWAVALDTQSLGFAAGRKLTTLLRRLEGNPLDTSALTAAHDLLAALADLHLELNVWEAQNICFRVFSAHCTAQQTAARQGSTAARAWLQAFDRLGRDLGVKAGNAP